MLKVPIHADGFSTSTYTAMECLNIDYIGPFPDGGYVLVVIDTFTRWVERFHTMLQLFQQPTVSYNISVVSVHLFNSVVIMGHISLLMS